MKRAEKRLGLVVALNDYKHYQSLKNSCAAASILVSSLRRLGVKKPLLLTNPKARKVVQKLKIIAKKLDDNSVFFFFFVGHAAVLGKQFESSEPQALLCWDASKSLNDPDRVKGVITAKMLMEILHSKRCKMIFGIDSFRGPLNDGKEIRYVQRGAGQLLGRLTNNYPHRFGIAHPKNGQQFAYDNLAFARSFDETIREIQHDEKIYFGKDWVRAVEDHLQRSNLGSLLNYEGGEISLNVSLQSDRKRLALYCLFLTAVFLTILFSVLFTKNRELVRNNGLLNDTVTALTGNVASLQTEKYELLTERKKMSQKVDILSQEKQTLAKQIEELTKSEKSLLEENNRLLAEAVDMKQEIENLSQEGRMLTEKIEELTKSEKSMREENNRLVTEAVDMKQEIEIFSQKSRMLKEKTAELEERAKSLQTENSRLSRQVVNLKREKDELSQQNKALTPKIEELSKCVETLNNQIRELSESSSKPIDGVEEFEADSGQLLAQVRLLKDEVARFESENGRLLAERDQLNVEKGALSLKNQKLEQSISELTKSIEGAKKQRTRLTGLLTEKLKHARLYELSETIAIADEILTLNPHDDQTRAFRDNALKKLGFVEGYVNMGNCYFDQGREDLALEQALNALGIDPNSKSAQELHAKSVDRIKLKRAIQRADRL